MAVTPIPSRRAPVRRTRCAGHERRGTCAQNPYVPTNRRVTQIVNGERSITGDTALRLAHFFGTTPEFWLNLQNLYELRLAQQKVGKMIKGFPTLKRFRNTSVFGDQDFGDNQCRKRSRTSSIEKVRACISVANASVYCCKSLLRPLPRLLGLVFRGRISVS